MYIQSESNAMHWIPYVSTLKIIWMSKDYSTIWVEFLMSSLIISANASIHLPIEIVGLHVVTLLGIQP